VRIKLLGTAAGGGFPQWNCACSNCSGLRDGSVRATARTQAQAAISFDGAHWSLLNASPDLRNQIERAPELAPHANGTSRNTPISSVVLTAADLDHVLGLLALREFQPLRIYSTPAVQQILRSNSFFRMLERLTGQSRWVDVLPEQSFSPEVPANGSSIHPIALGGKFPSYASGPMTAELDQAVMGLVIESGGKRLAYAPALPEAPDSLLQILESCDVIFIDGSFWSDDELQRSAANMPAAREIGHLPLSGNGGTLERLSGLKRPRKVLTHINNTNPILNEDSPENAQVRAAGWELGYDGWELDLKA